MTEDLQRDALPQQKNWDGNRPDGDIDVAEDASDESDAYFDFEYMFESNLASTNVHFTHAGIKDYLMDLGETGRDGIGVAENLAHARIALMCLQVVAHEAGEIDSAKSTWRVYAAEFFMGHLFEAGNGPNIPREIRSEALRLICVVFRDQEVMKSWVSDYPDLHYLLSDCTAKPPYFKAIQALCKDELPLAELDLSDHDWLHSNIESAAEFFKPLATCLVDLRLQDLFM